MAALPGIIGLLIFIYARPQEIITSLQSIPFLYLFLGLAIMGVIVDVNTRRTVIIKSPQFPFVIIFFFWCLVTLGIRNPSLLTSLGVNIAVSVTLYMIIAHGIQRTGGFLKSVFTIFALGVFVAFVGAHQGFSDFGCLIRDPVSREARGEPDGRPCQMSLDGEPYDGQAQCMEDGEEGLAYECEKIGLFGTSSIGGGRVRYLGVLQDPNELALATALAIPFAFAFFELRKTLFRLLLLLGTLATVATEIVFTQSRGGQICFGSVLGTYFIRKYGVKRGVIAAAALAVPLVMMGGREGEDAEHSSLERLNCAAEGIKMMIHYPITGVGYGQFTEHHFLTAHNAYILAAGELGFVGLVLFVVLLYTSIKIPISALRHDMPWDPDAAKAKSISMAMLAAFIGMCIGIFFLSWTYHYVLWIHLGLSGALYSLMKSKDPAFEVKVTRKEIFRIAVSCIVILIVWSLYIKRRGAWDGVYV